MDLYMMNCELLATCSALGYLEGDVYHKEPDCLESVKDLIRYLRHEDETRDIRQQLGAAQILQNDLVPMVNQYHQDKQLFDVLIRLMVNLTQPALLCFGKVPQDPTFRHHYLQVVSYLQAYKEAFANEKLFGSLSEKLYELLQLDWEQREDEDNLLIERILLLIRNILHIPADPEEEKSVDDDASTHDKVLWAMHMSGMDDLLKFLASSQTEQQWSMHVLEIISLMFRDQNPEQLAATGQARSAKDAGKDVRDLEILRQREAAEKKTRAFQRGTRHSRFGGSYIVQGLKAIGENDIVFHKGLHNFKNYSHDLGKAVQRVPKRRQVAREAEVHRRSALNVRLFLREFCIDFLENCYNRLMAIVKDHLIREQAQQHDETYYLWALAFFMAFNRFHRFRPELVSETVSIRTFHFVEQNLTNYYEMMLTDKNEAISWSRRMHLALKAYQELLATIHEMDRCKEEAVCESSRIIKSNIFYLMEYRELFLALFRKFDETKQPQSFLKDLVETVHLFLKMLEKFCKGRSNLVVQNKRVKKKKKTSKVHPAVSELHQKTPQELEALWQSLSEQLDEYAKSTAGLPEDMVVPFDAASEVPVEEQRADAMVQIQDCLLTSRGSEALSLLRAAREVWPEGDAFGAPELEPEEEVQLLKHILFAELHWQTAPRVEDPEELEEEEEIEEELQAVHVSEKEFNFLDYLKRFANSNVIKPYLLLLKSYQQNSAYTNHCVVKMLHRVAYELKMEALLFQLSVFCLFNRLLSDPAAGAYKELITFAKYILNRFFALGATNKKAFVELLFWKNTTVIREMVEGYRQSEDSDKHKCLNWSPAEQQQLKELYLEYREVEGVDVIDAILARLRPSNWTRRQVINQLVAMELADTVKDFKREKKGTRIVLWTQEQELELQRLFEEFQETDDILGNIMKNITAKRSRARIIEKLISMGLVSDRKELYKKRRRKKGKSHGSTDEFLEDLGMDEQDEREDEEEDDGNSDEEEEERAWEEMITSSREVVKVERLDLAGTGSLALDKQIQSLLQSLQQEGLSGSLLWLQNCLTRTADDREKDGISQAVPLVPLTEESEDAMENKQFQKLLKKVGARPPANEQESFWRIPAKLSPEQLRRMAASVVLKNTDEEEEEDGKEKILEAGQDAEERNPYLEQKAEALGALLQAKQKEQPSHLVSDSEKPAEDEGEVAKEQLWQKRPIESDSESEREEHVHSKPASKRVRVIDSEDEERNSREVTEQNQDSDSEGSLRPSKKRYSKIDEDED